MRYFFLSFTILISHFIFGQRANNEFQVSGGAGSSQSFFTAAYYRTWSIGRKKKFEFAVGERSTLYFGSNQNYNTSPAKLTSGSVSPAILFQDPIKTNIDTVFFSRPNVVTFNAGVGLSYQLVKRFSVNFSIDVLGLSFGSMRNGTYIDGSIRKAVTASPTAFNLLLIDDNDIGNLNSELSFCYKLTEKWGVKTGFQHLFTEYVTTSKVQQFPEPNDRFRNRSTLFVLGAVFRY